MKRKNFLFSIFCLLICFVVKAANIVSVSSGNWTTGSTWSTGTVPNNTDNVTVSAGHTITMSGNQGFCLSLTVNGTINWSQARTTNVGTGGLITNGATISGSGTLNVSGAFTINGTTNITNTNLSVTGTTTVVGTLIFNSIQGTKTFTNVVMGSGSVWQSNSNETQTITGSFTMNGGTINGTSTCRLNIAGTMNVLSGSNSISKSRLTVTGGVVVTGTVTIISTGGQKSIGGLTINSGGSWDNAVNEMWTITGNFSNNGTFNSGTNNYTFTGAAKTFGGSSNSIFNCPLIMNGTYTNNGYVTINNSLTGAGTWTQGAGILDVKCTIANFTVTNFTASGAGNTVIYSNAAGTTLRNPTGATYHHLTVEGATKTLPAATTCNGNVTIRTGTSLDVSASNFALNVGGNWSDSGTFIPRTSTTTLNGTSAQTIYKSGGETFYNIIFSGAGSKTLLSDITSSTNVTINAGTGTIAAGAFNITLPGNWTNNGGTFSGGTGTVFFTGTTAQTITKTGGENFNNLTFSNAGTKSLLSAIFATGNITINAGSGAFISNNNNINLGGNWTDNSTFTPGTCTVTFDGTAAQTITKTGGETFMHIAFSNAGTKTLLSALTINGNLTINSGSGTVSAGANNMSVAGNWTNNGGTFSPGTATVTFNGTAAQTIFKSGGETFGILVFSNAGTKTQLSDFSATGNITINAGSGALTGNGFNITLAGNWTDNSTFTAGTGTVTFNGTTAQTIFKTGGETFNHLVFSSAGTKTLLAPIICTGNLTLNSGSGAFSSGNFNINVAGNWTNNGVAFTPGTCTVTFDGTAAQTIYKTTTEGFNQLILSNAGTKTLLGNITVSGNITIDATSGTFSGGSFLINLAGNWVNNGPVFSPGTGILNLNGTSAQTLFRSGGETFNTIVCNLGGTKSLLSDITATGSIVFNASSGTVSSNNFNITIAGSWSNAGITFNAGTNTVTFNGSGAQTINKTVGENFNNLVFAGSGTTTLLSNINVAGNLTINSGTFSGSSFTTTLAGNWANNGGTYTPGTSTVDFNSTAAQTIFKSGGAETFGTLLFNGAGTKTQLSDFSASGNITINAGSGALIGNGFSILVGGNWSDNSSYTAGTGTVTFNGTAAQTLFKSGGETFYHLAFSGAGTKTFLDQVTVLGNVTINAGSGTIDAGNFNTTVSGNWTNGGSTFSPGTSTTTFNGTTAQTITKSAGETFGTLIFMNAGTKTLGGPVSANGNLTINSGTTVDVSSGSYQLSVGGNFTNNGTLQTQKGTILLNGTAAQTIGGSSITNFYNLTLNNTAGASLTIAENLYGALTLSNGTFNVNGQTFTMVSNASGTARIAAITGTGDISGNVIVQRYAAGGTTGWTFWGSPLSSALTFSAWNDDFAITCPSCPNGWPGSFTSIYSYNEAVSGLYDDANSYVGITAIGNTIVAGKGYWVYLGNGQTSTTAITADVTGSVRKFNYSIPLSYTNTGSSTDDGWNLICNPYPSPIKWTFLKGTTANIDNAIYAYNPDLNGGAGGYATFVNGISSPSAASGGITDTIPMCQGFYVHSTGATSLSATESNKVGGNPTFLKIMQGPQLNTAGVPMIRLKLTGNGYADEAVVYEQAGATDNFDGDYDAIKMLGGDQYTAWISLEVGGTAFQVNAVSPIQNAITIPVKTITGTSGNYTITASDFSVFVPGACLSLYDRFTGTTTDLRTASYSFYLADTTASPRFDLNIAVPALPAVLAVTAASSALPNSGSAVVTGAGNGPWNYSWMDGEGMIIRSKLNSFTADTLSNISGGIYTVQVTANSACSSGSLQVKIPIQMPVSYIHSGKQITIQNGIKNENVQVQLYDQTGRLVRTEAIYNTTHVMNLSELESGIYIMQFRSDSFNESHSLFVR